MAIHGVKPAISSDESEEPCQKLDDNQQKALAIAMQRAKDKKRMEFENKG